MKHIKKPAPLPSESAKAELEQISEQLLTAWAATHAAAGWPFTRPAAGRLQTGTLVELARQAEAGAERLRELAARLAAQYRQAR